MTNHTFVPILGKRLRVTTVDECGRIDEAGEEVQIVTDGFITINLTSEVEDGVEILQRKADGTLCVNERLVNSFKRFNVEVQFCGVNPQLFTKMTNAQPYLDAAGDTAGFTVSEGSIDSHFALELWTGLAGAACEADGDSIPGGYFLMPLVAGGTFGDLEIGGENAINFTVTGAMTKGGNSWGTGHYNVVRDDTGNDSVLPTALDPYDHLLVLDTALAPPPVSDQAGPIPDLEAA